MFFHRLQIVSSRFLLHFLIVRIFVCGLHVITDINIRLHELERSRVVGWDLGLGHKNG